MHNRYVFEDAIRWMLWMVSGISVLPSVASAQVANATTEHAPTE